MSISATLLADTLPSSVPKLDASGLNWVIFAVRFQDAVEAKGFWDPFNSTPPTTDSPESTGDVVGNPSGMHFEESRPLAHGHFARDSRTDQDYYDEYEYRRYQYFAETRPASTLTIR
ncbi:hypothetical protein BDZ97DRAFT_1918634 [Flammula alnicola]|nr:hypothetical protein BDZ97DRAFT_1918634 [Flammula alnicola]